MQTENDECFGGPLWSHVWCFSSPPAPFWHGFELPCVCFDVSVCFSGAFSRAAMGMLKGCGQHLGVGTPRRGAGEKSVREIQTRWGLLLTAQVEKHPFMSFCSRSSLLRGSFSWTNWAPDIAYLHAYIRRLFIGLNVIVALMNRGRRERRRRRDTLGVVEECWGRPSAVLPLFTSRTRRWDHFTCYITRNNPNSSVLRSRPVWEKLFLFLTLPSTCRVVSVAVGRYGCCSHPNLLKDTEAASPACCCFCKDLACLVFSGTLMAASWESAADATALLITSSILSSQR